jgi:PhnB protein
MAKAKRAVPEGLHTVTPMLTLEDTRKAIAWYSKALGAEQLSLAPGPDGKILHATIRIGNSQIMLHDAMMGGKAPNAMGGSPISLWIYVDDADSLFTRATKAGARVAPGPMGGMMDQFWGDRCGTIIDPEGYFWTIATRKEDLSPDEMQQRMKKVMSQSADQPG